jgi:hypothetical protein
MKRFVASSVPGDSAITSTSGSVAARDAHSKSKTPLVKGSGGGGHTHVGGWTVRSASSSPGVPGRFRFFFTGVAACVASLALAAQALPLSPSGRASWLPLDLAPALHPTALATCLTKSQHSHRLRGAALPRRRGAEEQSWRRPMRSVVEEQRSRGRRGVLFHARFPAACHRGAEDGEAKSRREEREGGEEPRVTGGSKILWHALDSRTLHDFSLIFVCVAYLKRVFFMLVI